MDYVQLIKDFEAIIKDANVSNAYSSLAEKYGVPRGTIKSLLYIYMYSNTSPLADVVKTMERVKGEM